MDGKTGTVIGIITKTGESYKMRPTDTIAGMIRVCEFFIEKGYQVHIEYKNSIVTVYGDDTVKKLKEKYAYLSERAPSPGDKGWEEYEKLMIGLEVELKCAGVNL